MSRIGKMPIVLPDQTNIEINGSSVCVRGKLGELNKSFPDVVNITFDNNVVNIAPKNSDKFSLAMWGTVRSVVFNMVCGVSNGFSTELEITGVGYKVAIIDGYLQLNIGNSHATKIEIPIGISVNVPKPTSIIISSIDKEMLGGFVALIIRQRPIEPYKGKGIKKAGTIVKLKEYKKS